MHKLHLKTAETQNTSIIRLSLYTCGRFVPPLIRLQVFCVCSFIFVSITRWRRSVLIWAGCWIKLLWLLLTATPTRERWFSTSSWSLDTTCSFPAPTSQELKPTFSSESFLPLPHPSGKDLMDVNQHELFETRTLWLCTKSQTCSYW